MQNDYDDEKYEPVVKRRSKTNNKNSARNVSNNKNKNNNNTFYTERKRINGITYVMILFLAALVILSALSNDSFITALKQNLQLEKNINEIVRTKNPALIRIHELTNLSHPPYLEKNYDLSQSYLEEILSIAKDELGYDMDFNPVDTDEREIARYAGLANAHIATIYTDQQKYYLAEARNYRAFEIWKKVHGVHNKETIIALEKVADMQVRQRKYENARKTYNDIIAIYETWTPTTAEAPFVDFYHGVAYYWIGMTYTYQRNHKKAYENYLNAKDLERKSGMKIQALDKSLSNAEKKLHE